MQHRRIMEAKVVATRCFFLAILVAGVIQSGVAFQPSNHLRVGKSRLIRFRRHHDHRRDQSSSLFGRVATDESIIASNREYLINVLGVSPNKVKTIETRRATKLQGGIIALQSGVLEQRVAWLKKRLNLTESECKKMIRRDPVVLSLQPETNLAPKIDYLQQKLRLDEKSLQKLVTSFPAIFGYKIEDNIEPKLDWLKQRLDLDDIKVGNMIRRCPQILGSSTSETLEPTLNWIQNRFSLTDDELSNLIQKLPTLFGCSVANNLEPTLNFYIDALGDEDKASGLVMKDPGIFTSSLEKRLKPRLEEARDAGLIIDARRLQRIAKYTEKQWSTSLDYQSKKLCVSNSEGLLGQA